MGGGESHSSASTTQRGTVTRGKSVIVLHDKTLRHLLCCAPIGEEGGKVCLQPIRECKLQAHSAPSRRNPVNDGILFRAPPWYNLTYSTPVGDVGMWAYHHYLVVSFFSSSISEWKMALNTWENTEDVEFKYQSPNHIV